MVWPSRAEVPFASGSSENFGISFTTFLQILHSVVTTPPSRSGRLVDMKRIHCLVLVAISSLASLGSTDAQTSTLPNRLIDYPGFLEDAAQVGKLRETRRISEADFIQMAAEAGTIVLDARSQEKFEMLHIKGALNLSLPDFTAGELEKLIPDKNARILIYCNNNFENERLAMMTKSGTSSLNIYTFNTLYSYGYRNVYELGPLLDIRKAKFDFVGSRAAQINEVK